MTEEKSITFSAASLASLVLDLYRPAPADNCRPENRDLPLLPWEMEPLAAADRLISRSLDQYALSVLSGVPAKEALKRIRAALLDDIQLAVGADQSEPGCDADAPGETQMLMRHTGSFTHPDEAHSKQRPPRNKKKVVGARMTQAGAGAKGHPVASIFTSVGEELLLA